MDVTIEMLKHVPAFEKLAEATLEHLAVDAVTLTRKSRESFYHQEDSPTGLFVLQSGHVKLYRQSKEKAQILAIIGPGECFGAESLPNDTPSPCAAQAITPVTVIHVPPDTLRQLMDTCPDLMVLLVELISGRLRQLAALVHDLAFRDVAARLAAILLERAEADGETTEEGLLLRRVLSQQEIASMVGTAREVIYRTFKKFEDDNLVRLTRKNILILDPQGLAAIARQETR